MDVIGEWWSMLIVRDFFLGGGQRRFEELRDSLGISRNILTERLRTLTDAAVIERVPLQEGGKRYTYQLTAKGRDLLPVLVAINQWSDRWEHDASRPRQGVRFMNMRDRTRGEEIAAVTVQDSRGETLSFGELYMTIVTPRGEVKIPEWPLDPANLQVADD